MAFVAGASLRSLWSGKRERQCHVKMESDGRGSSSMKPSAVLARGDRQRNVLNSYRLYSETLAGRTEQRRSNRGPERTRGNDTSDRGRRKKQRTPPQSRSSSSSPASSVPSASSPPSKDAVLASHFGLVVSIAQKHSSGSNFVVEDLIQQGMLGLCKAYSRYDANKGVKFSSYATHWIRSEVQSGRRNQSLIRYPKHMHDFMDKIRVSQKMFLLKHGRHPSVEELAEEISVPKGKVETRDGLQLDLGRPDCYLCSSVPEERTSRQLFREQMDNLLCQVLNEREQAVIRKKYALCGEGEEARTVDLASWFGVTSSRVRQIELRALSKMRSHCIKAGDMADLLDIS